MAFCRLFTLHFGFLAQPVESPASSQNRPRLQALLAPTALFPTAMGVAAPVTHRRLPISPKPWDARILKLSGYSQMEVAKDTISFNRNSHAKMAPDSDPLGLAPMVQASM
jgi:hypothetical protein